MSWQCGGCGNVVARVCDECSWCDQCCECAQDELFDADELGLDPELDGEKRYA